MRVSIACAAALMLSVGSAPAGAVPPAPEPGFFGASTARAVVNARRTPPPIKDCTPWNGRSGFYGNIFCSEREQQLWDRYGSGRRRGRS